MGVGVTAAATTMVDDASGGALVAAMKTTVGCVTGCCFTGGLVGGGFGCDTTPALGPVGGDGTAPADPVWEADDLDGTALGVG